MRFVCFFSLRWKLVFPFSVVVYAICMAVFVDLQGAMGEIGKTLYLVVVDDAEKKESFRYSRSVLQSTLQLIGCKARHAFKISQRVFELTKRGSSSNNLRPEGEVLSGCDAPKGNTVKKDGQCASVSLGKADLGNQLLFGKDCRIKSVPFEVYKRRTSAFIRRETFLDIVCDAMAEYKYVGPNQRADLLVACRIRERKDSVTVLLCGTSGCGKSTLSALLGSRLGITTVVSTDSIRHMMRSFADEKENPLLWASTYHAGECLDPVAVAKAKAKKKAKKLAGVSHSLPKDEVIEGQNSNKSDIQTSETSSGTAELLSPKQMAIEGYKAQSEMVIDSLDRLITAWEERKESVVVEGVHLSLNFVRKGSSRNLMALVNNDGSVAKAWPVDLVYSNGPENGAGHPMYGPLRIGKAEPVNLQFGFYGISAWPSDGGTSRAGSVDESRADGTDTGSRYHSSCCSSPRHSDAPAKELKEDFSVHGSDEEIDDQPEVGSDEDFSDDNGDKNVDEEEGSVDEESTKSDEEYDDLAMQDMIEEYGYCSGDEEEFRNKLAALADELGTKLHGNKYSQNLDHFLRTKSEPMAVPEPLCSYSSLLVEKSERKSRFRKRSLSIPALGKQRHTSAINDPILSGAPQRPCWVVGMAKEVSFRAMCALVHMSMDSDLTWGKLTEQLIARYGAPKFKSPSE
ncbi:hypothetical protein RJT34_29841 [Clitoria ternatea]|uniref:P-loop containing nucleoside triphosphate hydrolases superfamily protein n=1 Tax=Clitoria ternatea TaxID=43366 RepID=A0AAN9EVZ0_CLITE